MAGFLGGDADSGAYVALTDDGNAHLQSLGLWCGGPKNVGDMGGGRGVN